MSLLETFYFIYSKKNQTKRTENNLKNISQIFLLVISKKTTKICTIFKPSHNICRFAIKMLCEVQAVWKVSMIFVITSVLLIYPKCKWHSAGFWGLLRSCHVKPLFQMECLKFSKVRNCFYITNIENVNILFILNSFKLTVKFRFKQWFIIIFYL